MSQDEKSIWKKEISFRRKPERDLLGEEDAASVWKKEIRIRKKGIEPEVGPDTPADSEPIALEAVEPSLEPMPVAEPEPMPEPSLSPPPVILASVEHDWLTQPLEEVSEPPADPPTQPPTGPPTGPPTEPPTKLPAEPAITLVPQPEPWPQPEREPEPELPPVAETAQPPVLPAPVSEPPVPVVVPAEPALELPVLELPVELSEHPVADAVAPVATLGDAPKVPFYKRELSLKRSSSAKAEPAEKASSSKGRLSLKRKSRQWDAAEPAAEAKPKLLRAPRRRPTLSGAGSTKKIVGLKIGGSQIAAARIHNNGSPELIQAVRAPLEHGIVVGGELRDPEALAVALKEFFTRHKLPKRGVRLGIANNRIGVRTFDVVGIDDPKQLANAVRFRAQEVLPIPIEEAVLDYQVLSESVNEEGQRVHRVLLVVAYRELVVRYVYACRKAGIQVVGIDLEAFALLRAISEPHEPVPGVERGAVVAVSVGHDRSTFAVSDGRVCEFTRVLEWGGGALNVAIARALDISPSEAEPIKRGLSLAGADHPPEGLSEDQLATAREAVSRQLQTFARELVSSLQFYQNQPGSLGIGEIALTGGTAHLPGFAPELERLIGVPVRVADPMGRVKVSKKVRDLEQAGSLAIAIGLGIED